MNDDATQNSGMQDPAAQGAGAAQGAQASSNVPDVVMQKYPDLVTLIQKTESMNEEERDYWFQILPIMTDEQVVRLRGILEEEANELAKLDEQYQDELSKLNNKHLNEWDTMEKQKEREERAKVEEAHEEQEAAEEAAILDELENL